MMNGSGVDRTVKCEGDERATAMPSNRRTREGRRTSSCGPTRSCAQCFLKAGWSKGTPPTIHPCVCIGRAVPKSELHSVLIAESAKSSSQYLTTMNPTADVHHDHGASRQRNRFIPPRFAEVLLNPGPTNKSVSAMRRERRVNLLPLHVGERTPTRNDPDRIESLLVHLLVSQASRWAIVVVNNIKDPAAINNELHAWRARA
mmetsp:Transcript_17911/g.49138  ORF Transcript_17911/g.49138 Transcript_17911/m.49138 type:complete len:202 (+) Transcript_17911:167-772(+)